MCFGAFDNRCSGRYGGRRDVQLRSLVRRELSQGRSLG